MNDELYAHDKINNHHIYTTLDNGKFYFEIYFNGTNLKTITSYDYDRGIELCRNHLYKAEL